MNLNGKELQVNIHGLLYCVCVCGSLTRSPGLRICSFLVPSLFRRVYASFTLRLHSFPDRQKVKRGGGGVGEEEEEEGVRIPPPCHSVPVLSCWQHQHLNLRRITLSCLVSLVWRLTISQRVERFASDVKSREGGALPLSGPPTGQRSLQSWGPVTDHAQRLPFNWDDLPTLRFRCVGVRLGHCVKDRTTEERGSLRPAPGRNA